MDHETSRFSSPWDPELRPDDLGAILVEKLDQSNLVLLEPFFLSLFFLGGLTNMGLLVFYFWKANPRPPLRVK